MLVATVWYAKFHLVLRLASCGSIPALSRDDFLNPDAPQPDGLDDRSVGGNANRVRSHHIGGLHGASPRPFECVECLEARLFVQVQSPSRCALLVGVLAVFVLERKSRLAEASSVRTGRSLRRAPSAARPPELLCARFY